MAKLIITLIILVIGIIGIVVSTQNLISGSNTSNQSINTAKQQLDMDTTKLISDCTTFTNPTALQQCGLELTDIQQKCKTDPNYSGFMSCSDPRIQQIIDNVKTSINSISSSTTPSSSTDKLNTDVLNMINVCSSIYAPLDSCKASMLQVQSNCENTHLPACDDPRITQILNKQPPQPTQPTGDVISQSNQQVSDYLGICLTATQPSDIQSCSDTANKMINLCNSMQGGVPSECSDPRLQQVASRR